MKHNKLLLVLSFLLLANTINAQEFYVDAGLSTAIFKNYTNDVGSNSLVLSSSKPKKPFFEAGFILDILDKATRYSYFENRIKCNIALNYYTYEINTAYRNETTTVPIYYDLDYFSLKSGISYYFIDNYKFRLRLITNLSYDFLTYATYKYRSRIVDIKNQNTFDKTLLSIHGGFGAEYEILPNIIACLKFNIAESFKEKNKDSNIDESYNLRRNSISLGAIFNIIDRR
jgi:hypothetical protein